MDFEFEMVETLDWRFSNGVDFKDDHVREYDRHDLSPLPDPKEDHLSVKLEDMIDDAIADLEAEDRLGNFEIQRLMQMMNQNDTLESNVSKKTDDTANAVIGKV